MTTQRSEKRKWSLVRPFCARSSLWPPSASLPWFTAFKGTRHAAACLTATLQTRQCDASSTATWSLLYLPDAVFILQITLVIRIELPDCLFIVQGTPMFCFVFQIHRNFSWLLRIRIKWQEAAVYFLSKWCTSVVANYLTRKASLGYFLPPRPWRNKICCNLQSCYWMKFRNKSCYKYQSCFFSNKG